MEVELAATEPTVSDVQENEAKLFSGQAGKNWTETKNNGLNLKTGETVKQTLIFTYTLDNQDELPKKIDQCDWQKAVISYAQPGLKVAGSGQEKWVRDELLWDSYQLMAWVLYDELKGYRFPGIGGIYCLDLTRPRYMNHNLRDIIEHAFCIAPLDKEVACEGILYAFTEQYKNGGLDKWITVGQKKACEMDYETANEPHDSDTELWLGLALAEYIEITGDAGILDCNLRGRGGRQATVYERLKWSMRHSVEVLGKGERGLLLMAKGDWNDYLNALGKQGRGESVMNSELLAYSWQRVLDVVLRDDDAEFKKFVAREINAARQAVDKCFDEKWFTRAYADNGQVVGSEDDRLFLNAQSMAVLGRCGDREKWDMATNNALRECDSAAGLMLMSKAYPEELPEHFSHCQIPTGEGENAGIWPQTCDWFAMALAELGQHDKALEVWAATSLMKRFDKYGYQYIGVWTYPDCFNSHFSNNPGQTQIRGWNRAQLQLMTPAPAFKIWSWYKIMRNR